jgi:hypothetical protein
MIESNVKPRLHAIHSGQRRHDAGAFGGGRRPWDAVALVRYSSRQAFARMVRDSDYREKAGPLRAASLAHVRSAGVMRFGGLVEAENRVAD